MYGGYGPPDQEELDDSFEDNGPNAYGEVPIISARASVMIYDDANKKWVPSGSTQGLSKVQIYQHTSNNTFRVVGRKLQDHEVVINCAILKGLKYNQATPTFHQWRDSRQVYGLNFASREDAENFSQAMLTALETLNSLYRQPPPMAPPPQPPQPQPQGNIYAQAHNAVNGPSEQEDRMQRDEPPTHKRQMSGGGGMRETEEMLIQLLLGPVPRPMYVDPGRNLRAMEEPTGLRNPSLTGQEAVAPVNGGGALGGDMEALKQEILTEMRREMNKMKSEIIDVLPVYLSRGTSAERSPLTCYSCHDDPDDPEDCLLQEETCDPGEELNLGLLCATAKGLTVTATPQPLVFVNI
ncbi:ena/VASP-like protein [Aplysia californica]|uniref:Ena/VASP-like protein n=1 Tax=Aplysia californica TaxID=6500 RepID=A0ABM0ZYI6_APLCA|nr:ena/VASP-like protein [Aplysia californica]